MKGKYDKDKYKVVNKEAKYRKNNFKKEFLTSLQTHDAKHQELAKHKTIQRCRRLNVASEYNRSFNMTSMTILSDNIRNFER